MQGGLLARLHLREGRRTQGERKQSALISLTHPTARLASFGRRPRLFTVQSLQGLPPSLSNVFKAVCLSEGGNGSVGGGWSFKTSKKRQGEAPERMENVRGGGRKEARA